MHFPDADAGTHEPGKQQFDVEAGKSACGGFFGGLDGWVCTFTVNSHDSRATHLPPAAKQSRSRSTTATFRLVFGDCALPDLNSVTLSQAGVECLSRGHDEVHGSESEASAVMCYYHSPRCRPISFPPYH